MLKPSRKLLASVAGLQTLLIVATYLYIKRPSSSEKISSTNSKQSTIPAIQNLKFLELPTLDSQLKNFEFGETKLQKVLGVTKQVFNNDFLYHGQWHLTSGNNVVGTDQKTTKGETYSLFTNNWYPNAVTFIISFQDTRYEDSPRVSTYFVISYSDFYADNCTFVVNPENHGFMRLSRITHLAFREVIDSYDYVVKISLTDISTGKPFAFETNDTAASNTDTLESNQTAIERLKNLKVRVEVKSIDTNFTLISEMTFFETPSESYLQAVIFSALSLIGLMMIIHGSNQLENNHDYYFMSNLSYVSLLILTLIHFQFIGAFVLCIVITDSAIALLFIFASIITTCTTVFMYKAACLVFLYNFIGHPRIDDFNWNSPRVVFVTVSLVSFVAFYSMSIFMVGFKQYAYYMIVLYCYPIFHIVNSVLRGTRQTFSPHLQLCLWCPSVLYAIMLRGYDGNILNLEPSYFMSFFIVIMTLGCTLISYFQQTKGPFFFLPKRVIPGYQKMLIPVSKVPDDTLLEYCPICYVILLADPLKDEEIELHENGKFGDLKTSLINKNRQIMKTPCNHYLHEGCLTAWLDKKQECPVCKRKITYF